MNSTDPPAALRQKKGTRLALSKEGMPPKGKAKPKPKARPQRTIYDDLPKDLRATAKDMDRLQAIRGGEKVIHALNGINFALRKLSDCT